MFTLEQFSQSIMLRNETDPEIRRGVCVALCDYWLNEIKARPTDPPAGRLRRVAMNYQAIVAYQRQYGQARAQQGPEQARRAMGQQLGHDYHQQTTILRAFMSAGELRQRLAGDLGMLGAAVTWSMRFPDDTGHAIAGFRGLLTIMENMHRASLHLFDPNIGEYVGELGELDLMLNDLLNHFPLYRTVQEIRRTTDKR